MGWAVLALRARPAAHARWVLTFSIMVLAIGTVWLSAVRICSDVISCRE